MASGALPGAHPHIVGGTLKGIAVTGEKRWFDLPNVPTMVEAGYPGFVLDTYVMMLVPAKTPPEIVDRLSAATLGRPEEARRRRQGTHRRPRSDRGRPEGTEGAHRQRVSAVAGSRQDRRHHAAVTADGCSELGRQSEEAGIAGRDTRAAGKRRRVDRAHPDPNLDLMSDQMLKRQLTSTCRKIHS